MAKKQESNGFPELKQALKYGALKRLYIFSGEESYLRMYYLNACKEAVLGDGAFAEFNLFEFDGKTVTRSMWVSPLSADPQINFTRTASATSAAQGETVTLTYRVANEGSVTLRDVQVYDDMPGVGLVGTIDSLYPGNMRELTVQVIVDEDKTSSPRLTYHTDAQSQSTVYVLENLEIVVYNPNLTVTLKADDSLVDAGQSVTLVCNVVNDGNVDFSSATITDETLGTIIEGATI